MVDVIESIEDCTAAMSSLSGPFLLDVDCCFFLLLEAEMLNASSASGFRLLSVASSTDEELNASSALRFKSLHVFLLLEGEALSNNFLLWTLNHCRFFFSEGALLKASTALCFSLPHAPATHLTK